MIKLKNRKIVRCQECGCRLRKVNAKYLVKGEPLCIICYINKKKMLEYFKQEESIKSKERTDM